jgi:hypothetical protein
MVSSIFTITNHITAALAHIERARGFLDATTLSEACMQEMGHRALILEAHQSALIPIVAVCSVI